VGCVDHVNVVGHGLKMTMNGFTTQFLGPQHAHHQLCDNAEGWGGVTPIHLATSGEDVVPLDRMGPAGQFDSAFY
jgi:hypothetical protein